MYVWEGPVCMLGGARYDGQGPICGRGPRLCMLCVILGNSLSFVFTVSCFNSSCTSGFEREWPVMIEQHIL